MGVFENVKQVEIFGKKPSVFRFVKEKKHGSPGKETIMYYGLKGANEKYYHRIGRPSSMDKKTPYWRVKSGKLTIFKN